MNTTNTTPDSGCALTDHTQFDWLRPYRAVRHCVRCQREAGDDRYQHVDACVHLGARAVLRGIMLHLDYL